MPAPRPEPLTEATLGEAARTLASGDPDLAAILASRGTPPLWAREPGFPTLVLIVLEQQVSLASARAAFDRLSAAGPVEPARFLDHDDAALLRFGFSRQKARYVRELASAVGGGRLDLAALSEADDAEVQARLTSLPGIGPWSATIYLLTALRRPDVWPTGDLALAAAVQAAKALGRRPGAHDLETIAEPWRPWRAVAARLLWSDYLGRRAAKRSSDLSV
jgi:DNA-3-methyladenine glycosylase II